MRKTARPTTRTRPSNSATNAASTKRRSTRPSEPVPLPPDGQQRYNENALNDMLRCVERLRRETGTRPDVVAAPRAECAHRNAGA
jgi:hypothetical protein